MIGTWITETSVVYARALWDDGLATSEIARRIRDGCTKSAIVGYAHRNGFPPRPSPIIRGGQRAEAVPRVPKKPHRKRTEQQPPLAKSNINEPNGNTPPMGLEPQQKASLARRAPKPAPKSPPAVAALKVACRPDPLAVPSPPHRSCQWIPESCTHRPWRFCDAPTVKQSAWCAEHFPRCYSRPPRWSYAHEAPA